MASASPRYEPASLRAPLDPPTGDHGSVEDLRARRVLAVLTADLQRFPDVRARARMDTANCARALRRLLSRGLIDVVELRRGPGGGSGAPAFAYRRRALPVALRRPA